MKERILLAGGSGFVGTNILELISKYYKNIDSTFHSKKKFYRVKGVNYFKADLEKKITCRKICKDIDTVIMCAANSSGAQDINNNPLFHLNSNLRMNINILEAAYEMKVKRFIFISSNTVYPFSNLHVCEKDAKFRFYKKYYIVGWMKRFSEILCDIYSNKLKKKMTTIVIRPGNLYGPHDKFDKNKSKVIPSLIKKVVEKENPISVWGNGNDLKDFLYIKDFAKSILKILQSVQHPEIINIASGKGVTVKTILSKIIKIEKLKNYKIYFDKSKPTMIPKRLISIKKAKKIINFYPTTNLDSGLKKTVTWYKKIFLKNDHRKNPL
jgi:GDP-L-fucose synthase